jgi:hypothetical protein
MVPWKRSLSKSSIARPLLLATALALVTALGCGGDSGDWYPDSGTDEEQITAVAERYETAADEADTLMLCRDVLPPSRLPGMSEGSCAQILDAQLQQALDSDFLDGEDIEVRGVEVHQNSATARVIDGGEPSTFDFVSEEGRWYLEVFD